MSRSEIYERDAAAMIDDAVSCFRNRGLTRQVATQECARWLGMRARRVHSLLFGEPIRLDGEEYTALRAVYMRLLDDEAQDLERRATKMRAKLQEMRGTIDGEATSATLVEGR